MLQERSRKHDLVALALAALAAFLGISLACYNPADPPTTLVYPPSAHVTNACGMAGALAADVLLTALGAGAYYLAASLGIAAALLLARRPISDPWLRGVGWLATLVAVDSLVAIASPGSWTGPAIGAGGYLGAAGAGLLELHFARAGAYLLAISVLAGGVLLCTDYVLPRLVLRIVGLPFGLASWAFAPRRAPARPAAVQSSPQAAKTGAATAGEAAADAAATTDLSLPTGLQVRIAGKPAVDDLPRTIELASDDSTDDSTDGADDSTDGSDASDDEAEVDEEAHATLAADASAGAPPAAAKAPPTAKKSRTSLRIRTPGKNDREEVMEELDAASRTADVRSYELPAIDMLLPGDVVSYDEHEKDVRRKAKILEKTFLDFGFKVKVVEVETGPVIAQFEVELEAGLRLSKITSLADDLAIALRVPSVRIVAPIPGKNTVGIEVPNAERQLVRIREVIVESNLTNSKMRIPIFLGKDVSGKPMVVDLTTLPHLLIAGRTGTGKSVCLNSIIISMLMSRRPDEVRMLMIDPKMVELSPYKTLPHLMHPVVTDMKKAEAILAWAVEKMEERYALLARAGVRHISVYNQLGEDELMERLQLEDEEERNSVPTHLPFIVIVADEMADLMMTAAKEVEQHIIRLAQKSRAVGIHLVLATQKPTVDVITGLIKSNLPARIAFQVASRTDSRVVLDEMGADKLLGNGDLLFLWPGTSTLLRGQGAYVSDDEINRVVDFVGATEPQFVSELMQLKTPAAEQAGAGGGRLPNRDELYEAAVDVVIREGRGSVSLLQRALGIGYGRAARLVDYMAEDGIVGAYNGSQAREVIITPEQWAEMSGSPPSAPAAPEPKSNRVLSFGKSESGERPGPKSFKRDESPRRDDSAEGAEPSRRDEPSRQGGPSRRDAASGASASRSKANGESALAVDEEDEESLEEEDWTADETSEEVDSADEELADELADETAEDKAADESDQEAEEEVDDEADEDLDDVDEEAEEPSDELADDEADEASDEPADDDAEELSDDEADEAFDEADADALKQPVRSLLHGKEEHKVDEKQSNAGPARAARPRRSGGYEAESA